MYVRTFNVKLNGRISVIECESVVRDMSVQTYTHVK